VSRLGIGIELFYRGGYADEIQNNTKNKNSNKGGAFEKFYHIS